MKIAVVAPGAVPATFGGAERLAAGLVRAINQRTGHTAELVEIRAPERTFKEVIFSYENFSNLDLSTFDRVITGKYPSWMVRHPTHHLYLLHPLRGLYDTYDLCKPNFGWPGPDAKVRAVERALDALSSRAGLPALFDALRGLVASHDEGDPAIAFPGPLIRNVVRALDSLAVAPGSIARYAAISRTVVNRPGFIPPHVQMHVAHPPSDLAVREEGPFADLVTVSRLDGPKRVRLLIEAMQYVRADVRLLIAGTGPERDRLEQRAANDRRIEFLGFVPDADLADLYSRAIAVPFVPADEDFGLVALEAGMAGKPVITTLDSGGPREVVLPGRTGLVVEPTAQALGQALNRLVNNPGLAEQLGAAAREHARTITWDRVLEQVIGDRDSAAKTARGHQRIRRSLAPRVTVVSTFPVHPRRGGGQLRAYELYGRLAPVYDVEILSLCSRGAAETGWHDLGTGFRELVVEKSQAQIEAEASEASVAGVPVDDIVASRLAPLTPDFEQALAASLSGTGAVILCHPFLAPVVRRLHSSVPLVYDAHNAEISLKGQVLGSSGVAEGLLAEVREAEGMACAEATFVTVASDDDATVLNRLYGLDHSKMTIIPNGVDSQSNAYVPPADRARNKSRWRSAFERQIGEAAPAHVALFVASWHPPNIEAAKALLQMAPELGDLQFLLVGSHTAALDGIRLPSNVSLLGEVSNKTLKSLLATADLGLNPMLSGGGSNLKMFEYLAVGLPVVTTATGARGVSTTSDHCFTVEAIERFPVAIRELLEDPDRATDQASRGRDLIEALYDWEILAGLFRREMRTIVRGVRTNVPQVRTEIGALR